MKRLEVLLAVICVFSFTASSCSNENIADNHTDYKQDFEAIELEEAPEVTMPEPEEDPKVITPEPEEDPKVTMPEIEETSETSVQSIESYEIYDNYHYVYEGLYNPYGDGNIDYDANSREVNLKAVRFVIERDGDELTASLWGAHKDDELTASTCGAYEDEGVTLTGEIDGVKVKLYEIKDEKTIGIYEFTTEGRHVYGTYTSLTENITFELSLSLIYIGVGECDAKVITPLGFSSRADAESYFRWSRAYDSYSWLRTERKELDSQLFFGKWKIIREVPSEIHVSSDNSDYNIDGSFRGQDLVENIVGQELIFEEDYVENQGVKYELARSYKTYSFSLSSEDTVIGCNSAKTLGITSDYFSVVFFTIPHGDRKEEGKRDFTSLNQLYLKDNDTIYASVNGCLTFELRRVSIFD